MTLTAAEATALITALSGFAWPAAVFAVFWFLRTPISLLVNALIYQVKSGASFKYGDIELVGVKVEEFELLHGSGYEKVGADPELKKYREEWKSRDRSIFFVHRVKKTTEFDKKNGFPLYDVSIYLISHKGQGALNGIKFVEYQFGERENSEYPEGAGYTVRNSFGGFAFRRLSTGPTYCAARVNFQDGSSTIINRYLDFEGTGFVFDPNVEAKLTEGRH